MQNPTTPIESPVVASWSGEEVDRTAHVAPRPIGRHRLHQLAGLVHLGVLGEVAVVEVGARATNPSAGEAVGHLLDAGVEPPPLLHDDQTRAGSAVGNDQIAGGSAAVARKLDRLTCELTHAPNGRRWSPMCHTLAP